MTTKKRCAELIRLCTGLDFFPADAPARELLVETLRRRADSDEHAERIIDRWIETERKAPVPADIVQLARDIPLGAEGAIPGGCPECQGQDWVVQETKEHSAAGRCSCPRGRFLMARDVERQGNKR